MAIGDSVPDANAKERIGTVSNAGVEGHQGPLVLWKRKATTSPERGNHQETFPLK